MCKQTVLSSFYTPCKTTVTKKEISVTCSKHFNSWKGDHRISKVGKDLQDHPVQPSIYHQYFPIKPRPLVPHLNVFLHCECVLHLGKHITVPAAPHQGTVSPAAASWCCSPSKSQCWSLFRRAVAVGGTHIGAGEECEEVWAPLPTPVSLRGGKVKELGVKGESWAWQKGWCVKRYFSFVFVYHSTL